MRVFIFLVILILSGFTAFLFLNHRTLPQADSTKAKLAADKMAHSIGETVHLTGTQRYPWGTVWHFENRRTQGQDIVIEVSQDTNVVTAVSILGNSPTNVYIDNETALNAARKFIKEHAPEVNLDAFIPKITPPSDSGTIKVYEIEWQSFSSTGALLASRITVDVRADTGIVSNYSNIDIPTKIDISPKLSKEKALQILLKPSKILPKNVSIEGPILEVISDPRITTGQRLVWSFLVNFPQDDEAMTPARSRMIMIDANSGVIVDLDEIFK